MIQYKMVDTPKDTTGTECSNSDSTSTQLMGRCKWFNNKAGYGFLTVAAAGDDKWDGVDVFVHHSAVTTGTEQYKYLVQGEYVSFRLQEMSDGDHEYQASDVRGVNGGKLMCETRNENRTTRGEGEGDDVSTERRSRNTSRRSGPQGDRRRNTSQRVQVHVRGTGPREGEEWMLVRKKTRGSNTRGSSNNRQSSHGEDE